MVVRAGASPSGGGAWYEPDFRVMQSGVEIQFVEVKGHWREAARVRIKVAASGGGNKVELGFASDPTQAQLDVMTAQLQIMRNVAPVTPLGPDESEDA